MITKANRPADWTERDTLAAVLASAGRDLGMADPFRFATEACRPLYSRHPSVGRDWYPGISRDHAKAAIATAGKTLADDGMSRAEYDFVCDKLRRVLVRALPMEPPNAETDA